MIGNGSPRCSDVSSETLMMMMMSIIIIIIIIIITGREILDFQNVEIDLNILRFNGLKIED